MAIYRLWVRHARYDLATARYDLERQLVVTALDETKGNKAAAARLLGVARPTLYSKLVQRELSNHRDTIATPIVVHSLRLQSARETLEHIFLEHALVQTEGSAGKAAKLLAIGRPQVYYIARKCGIGVGSDFEAHSVAGEQNGI